MPEPDNRELCVTCFIAAKPERVWDIMTNRLIEYWCPKPWQTEIIELDWQAGGRCAMVMRGPDGASSEQEGIFLNVTPGRSFAFTDAVRHDLTPQEPFMIGIFQIAPEGEGTRYTASARHWTDAAMEQHKSMGFAEGWGIVADQLKQVAEAPD